VKWVDGGFVLTVPAERTTEHAALNGLRDAILVFAPGEARAQVGRRFGRRVRCLLDSRPPDIARDLDLEVGERLFESARRANVVDASPADPDGPSLGPLIKLAAKKKLQNNAYYLRRGIRRERLILR
jgi:hypothetical protein